jgi:hypothetical protein
MVSEKEEFDDAKGVIRISILKKNRQHNGQQKKYKRTSNDLQNILKNTRSSNANPTKNRGLTQVIRKGRQVLLH